MHIQLNPEYATRLGLAEQLLGVLPEMMVTGSESYFENLSNNYPWFSAWNQPEGATVDSEGNWCYPEDEPMACIAKIEDTEENVYIFPYGIVAVTDKLDQLKKWSRFD